MFVILTTAAVLVGWRWYSDRHRTRPTDRERDVAYRVDLNRATRSELMQVPGVGPQLAERIVSHRESQGPFRKVDELDRIPGIGGATLDRMRPWVTVHATDAGGIVAEPDRLFRKPAAPPAPKSGSRVVNVNRASLEELDTLPNIGPVLAQRIIDERAKRPFTSVEDLGRVSGLGPKRREALRGLVTFD
jgi:competence protein ComEA